MSELTAVETEVRVDRIACTGHGVCHALLGDRMPLDEFGYPIPSQVAPQESEAAASITLCPAAALHRGRD